MDIKRIATLVGLAAAAGFFGSFLLGVADHRRVDAVIDFADKHISFPTERQPFLVFSCGNSEDLVAYDLLEDEVLSKKEAIKRRLSDPLNKALQSDLFSHYTAYTAEAFGVFFSLKDELKQWKAREASGRRVSGIAAAFAVATYPGYLASSWFELECSSRTLYERLSDKKFWAPYRLNAAQTLFEGLSYCIDRSITVETRNPFEELTRPISTGARDLSDNLERRKALEDWRKYISLANQDIPKPTALEEQKPEVFKMGKATWGDNIYYRLYGDGSWRGDYDFDRADFRALVAIDQKCDKLDREVAKHLYSRVLHQFNSRQDGFAYLRQEHKFSMFFKHRDQLVKALVYSLECRPPCMPPNVIEAPVVDLEVHTNADTTNPHQPAER